MTSTLKEIKRLIVADTSHLYKTRKVSKVYCTAENDAPYENWHPMFRVSTNFGIVISKDNKETLKFIIVTRKLIPLIWFVVDKKSKEVMDTFVFYCTKHSKRDFNLLENIKKDIPSCYPKINLEMFDMVNKTVELIDFEGKKYILENFNEREHSVYVGYNDNMVKPFILEVKTKFHIFSEEVQ